MSPLSKYSSYVKLMKVALPVGIITAIGLSFGWPYFLSIRKEEAKLTNLSKPKIKENHMVNPQYAATDASGKPYTIQADWAKQRTQTLTDLAHPRGMLQTKDNEIIQIQADKGVYDNEKRELSLTSAISLESSDGYRIETERLTISLDDHWIQSNQPVRGKGPMGKLTGQNGFHIETLPDGARVVTLKGPSSLTLIPNILKKTMKKHDK